MIDRTKAGDRVSYAGRRGTITRKTYSRAVVRFDDGTEEAFTRRLVQGFPLWLAKGVPIDLNAPRPEMEMVGT